ncbi:MAG TPA: MarR family transcriptional regulator [Acidimicrobiales bacterium]
METTTSTAADRVDAVDPVDLADAFFAVSHALKRAINARVQPTGLSLARLRVLYQLVAVDGIRLGELSTCVDVAPRTMTSTIEAMERDGLVERRPDPNDGRATIVRITDAGRRSFAEGRRLQASVVADLFAALDEDQQAVLADALDHLARLAGASDIDAR